MNDSVSEFQKLTSEERVGLLDSILETAVDAIVTIDQRGLIESFNHAASDIFGYTTDEVLGKNVSMLMLSPDQELHDEYLKNYLNTGTKKIIGIGRQVIGKRKDGSTLALELAVSEVSITDRVFFVGILRDITNRLQAEVDARRQLDEHAHAARLAVLGEMVSGVTHELNQPLAAIVSFAEAAKRMLKSNPKELEPVKDSVSRISDQGQRAGRILNELKQFVRKSKPVLEQCDINQLVNRVLNLLGHQFWEQRVEVKVLLNAEPVFAYVNPIQLEQVIINLVLNGIDATSGGEAAEVCIATSYIGDKLELKISDNGQGIEADIFDRIFDAFYTTKSEGTGLGLSISRSIIEAHNGTLLASNNASEGACFTICLPRAEDEG
ncbi:MAG: PAS domain S-box protein [Planctomycetaceae bacterium]|jgi:two-component system, LuxR family, sensor kinase FixL|nr:PAS domain S-box protein [Planctomycetaceae bacterium]MBT7671311.1 PAS domain S-box protein [Pseudomonadota bacterium]